MQVNVSNSDFVDSLIKVWFMSGHPLFEKMKFQPVKVESGTAIVRMPFTHELSDSRGALHRGALITLADSACGMATFSILEEFVPIATVDLRMDYADPIPPASCRERV